MLLFTGFRIERECEKGDPSWLQTQGMAAMWRVAGETGQAVCAMCHPEDLVNLDVMCAAYPDTVLVIDHSALTSNRHLRRVKG